MRALVAGATGFVGRKLAPALLEDEHEVRCLTREPDGEAAAALAAAGCEIVGGDLADPGEVAAALGGVELAYFLVHMMSEGEGYAERERAAAEAFAEAAGSAEVERTIYLGGLGDDAGSEHLASRAATARILAGGPPVTYFRAAMIIGAGSESYGLLRGVVEKLPALTTPPWMETETQPIGIRDVIAYLRQAPHVSKSAGREVQIGGPEVVTHLELVEEMARLLGRRAPRRIKTSPRIARPETIAAGAAAVTPGSPEVAAELGMGLPVRTVVDDPSGAALFEVRPEPLRVVLQRAIDESERDEQAPEPLEAR